MLPTAREVSSTNIINVLLRLAGKHVPTAGGQRTDFSTPFPLFLDHQGPAVFPRAAFLYKEINSELQEMKVIALAFQFAHENRAQTLQSFPYSSGKTQHPKNKFLHVWFLLAA